MASCYHSEKDLVNSEYLLPRSFYHQDVLVFARQLLGKRLFRRTDEGTVSGTIVETEAYRADDPASHSFRGKTARNSPMFEEGGHTYIYLSYGIHDMLNIVCAPVGVAEAVLIRAVMPNHGIDLMRIRTSKPTSDIERLASGPGLVAKAFGISWRRDSNIDVTTKEGGIWIANGEEIKVDKVTVTTRIGITKAADKPWRFYISGNRAVSRI